jgi:hypothetical protein
MLPLCFVITNYDCSESIQNHSRNIALLGLYIPFISGSGSSLRDDMGVTPQAALLLDAFRLYNNVQFLIGYDSIEYEVFYFMSAIKFNWELAALNLKI